MSKILFFCLCVLFLVSCSTYNVVKVNDSQSVENKKGFYYSLPRTVLTIDVTITKLDKTKGIYSDYASKLLGINNAIGNNSTSYELSNFDINSFSEPDSNQYYFVDLSKYKSFFKDNLMVSLKESGIVQDINTNSSQVAQNTVTQQNTKQTIDYSETFKYYTNDNLVEKIDTIFEQVKQDSVTYEKMILKKTMVEKSYEEKAIEAAEFIRKIKQQRIDILTGAQEVAYDAGTIKVMVSELDRLEKEYLTLFYGTTSLETMHFRFYYLPDNQNVSQMIPLFRFSKYNGIVADPSEDAETVFIKVDKSGNTQKLANFTKGNVVSEQNGYFYRIPENAKFSIFQEKTLKAEASFMIAQFGITTSLPARNFKIQFYPNTGGIKALELIK